MPKRILDGDAMHAKIPNWNRVRDLASSHRSRARKYGVAANSFTGLQWHKLKEITGRRCLKCGIHEEYLTEVVKYRPNLLSPDHIIPLHIGGDNTIENIQPLCEICNFQKGILIADFRTPNIVRWARRELLRLRDL